MANFLRKRARGQRHKLFRIYLGDFLISERKAATFRQACSAWVDGFGDPELYDPIALTYRGKPLTQEPMA